MAVLPVAAEAAGRAPGRAQTPPSGQVHVTVRAIDAVLTGAPDDVLTLRVTVTNTSAAQINRLRWRLRLGAPVVTRAELSAMPPAGTESVLWEPPFDSSCLVDCVERFLPGTSHDIDLVVPAAALTLPGADRPTVYRVRLELTSRTLPLGGGAETFLIWAPRTQRTLRVGWLVPIVDVPRRDAFGLHIGDALARSIAEGGRLDRILDALERAQLVADGREPPLAVTLAVDAELVEAVADMADGYLRAGTPTPTQRPASDDAASWLSRLRALARRHPVFALPYADVDVVALVRAGLGTDVASAIDAGRRGVTETLGGSPVTTIAWPPQGLVDSTTLGVLASNGINTVVLDDGALPVTAARTYTTTAAANLETTGRTLTGVVADSWLVRLANTPRSAGGVTALVRQRILAETAVLHQQRPSRARDVLLPLPRIWSPRDVEGAAQLIAATTTAPWLTSTTVPEMAAAEGRADNRATAPQYADAARNAELPGPALSELAQQRADLLSFRTMLAPTENAEHLERSTAIKAELDAAQVGLTRAESVHWRGKPANPRRLRRQVRDRLTAFRDSLDVVFNQVTLTSRSGPIPITINNRLGAPVELRVDVSSPRAGITFGQRTDPIVVQPGPETIDVRFEAVSVGRFPVTVQLLNAERAPIGTPATAVVRTTAYGPVALAVTGVAFGLLVIAAAVRIILRRRRGPGTEPVAAAEPQPLSPVGGSDQQ